MSLVTNIDNIFKRGVVGNVRKAQEDSHDTALRTPNGDVFVVCDGMGGAVGGAKASSIAVESIIEYLKAERYPNPIAALDGALQFANMQILGFADANPEFKGMGTTACIVLMQDDNVWIAHVGDSRIYLYLGDEKKLHRITKDHSYVQSLVDQGTITNAQAEHHPNKNRILKALGIKQDLQPTFNYENHPIHPLNGDIFLICSDGLSGEICDATIERVLSEDTSLENRGNKLIALAMQGENGVQGGKDNCTLELMQVDNSPWEERLFKSYNPEEGTYGMGKSNKAMAGTNANAPDKLLKNNNVIIGISVASVLTAISILAIVLLATPKHKENANGNAPTEVLTNGEQGKGGSENGVANGTTGTTATTETNEQEIQQFEKKLNKLKGYQTGLLNLNIRYKLDEKKREDKIINETLELFKNGDKNKRKELNSYVDQQINKKTTQKAKTSTKKRQKS